MHNGLGLLHDDILFRGWHSIVGGGVVVIFVESFATQAIHNEVEGNLE